MYLRNKVARIADGPTVKHGPIRLQAVAPLHSSQALAHGRSRRSIEVSAQTCLLTSSPSSRTLTPTVQH